MRVFARQLEVVCVVPISCAKLWTWFVTPRTDWAQQNQTTWVSYCIGRWLEWSSLVDHLSSLTLELGAYNKSVLTSLNT